MSLQSMSNCWALTGVSAPQRAILVVYDILWLQMSAQSSENTETLLYDHCCIEMIYIKNNLGFQITDKTFVVQENLLSLQNKPTCY